jgi:hypothetical protein
LDRRVVQAPPEGSTGLHACCTRGFRKCRCVAPSRHGVFRVRAREETPDYEQ